MITIAAKCQTCDWTWKPRKAEGPERDFSRAKAAAEAHARDNRGHTLETSFRDTGGSVSGRSRFRIVDVEIVRR